MTNFPAVLELFFLGRSANVEVFVEGGDESPADEQRTAFRLLPDSIAKAETVVFEFYERIYQDYRAQFGMDAGARMPKVTEASELAQLVNLTGVVFPEVTHPGEITIGFLFECSWDPEHGLGVKFTNGNAEVGSQDILT